MVSTCFPGEDKNVIGQNSIPICAKIHIQKLCPVLLLPSILFLFDRISKFYIYGKRERKVWPITFWSIVGNQKWITTFFCAPESFLSHDPVKSKLWSYKVESQRAPIVDDTASNHLHPLRDQKFTPAMWNHQGVTLSLFLEAKNFITLDPSFKITRDHEASGIKGGRIVAEHFFSEQTGGKPLMHIITLPHFTWGVWIPQW